jgi:hypothetical protein
MKEAPSRHEISQAVARTRPRPRLRIFGQEYDTSKMLPGVTYLVYFQPDPEGYHAQAYMYPKPTFLGYHGNKPRRPAVPLAWK